MIKRLRVKFVVTNMLIVTLMLAVIFSLVLFFTGENLERQGLQQMQQVAEQPGRNEGFRDLPKPGWTPPHFTLRVDENGVALEEGTGFDEITDGEFLEEMAGKAMADRKQTGILREHFLRYFRMDTPKGQRLIFMDASTEMGVMQDLIKSCLLIGAVGFGVFLIISIFLARWAIRPVEQAFSQQRQFVADASHELKTPLTVIMTNAELLQEDACTEAERGRSIQSIRTMSQQMRGLVESLLELARVDNGTAKMDVSRLDLSQLIQEAVLPFEPVYFERELTLETCIQEGITVKGSRSHLHQVVDVLLDNAAKYTAAPGAVTVELKKQGKHVLLTVKNPGAPLTKEELKNIFKRFYRADKARSMNGSYGLGLAIAQEIVKTHGGKIWAESDQGVNTFCVQLPMA